MRAEARIRFAHLTDDGRHNVVGLEVRWSI